MLPLDANIFLFIGFEVSALGFRLCRSLRGSQEHKRAVEMCMYMYIEIEGV